MQRRHQLRAVLRRVTHEIELSSKSVLRHYLLRVNLILIQNQIRPNIFLLDARSRLWLSVVLTLGWRGEVKEVLFEVAQLLEEDVAIVST